MATIAKRKRAPRIQGICRAAKELGYNREHLRLVIIGERRSPNLLKLFREWQAGKFAVKSQQPLKARQVAEQPLVPPPIARVFRGIVPGAEVPGLDPELKYEMWVNYFPATGKTPVIPPPDQSPK